MVNYSCEKCGKEFSQKGHYTNHLNKKNPCVVESKVKEMLYKVIDAKLKLLSNKIVVFENDKVNCNTDEPEHVFNEKQSKEIKYIDLFCGLGSFHTAFNKNNIIQNKVKYTCVLSCDINEGVRKLYEENYGIKPAGDINEINIDTMPDFDILCAGFPCQPFSIAGNQQGFKDKTRGNLFYKLLEIIDKKQPTTLMLENVKNLHTIHKGETFKIIKTE